VKALVKFGRAKGEVQLRYLPVPEVGPGDVLIEVRAAGICGSDIGFYDGVHEEVCRPPVVLGHEFAGVVSRVGSGVKDWAPGDRVVSDNTGYICGRCHACSTANYLLCPEHRGLGYGMDGGFTRFVKIDGSLLARIPNTLFRIPSGIPFDHAAILDPAANAYRAVVQEGSLLPGENVTVFGVGALGLFSIQVARIAGAAKIFAIGLSSDTERFSAAAALGATRCIAADTEEAVGIVRSDTGGAGADLVIDAAGPSSVLRQSLALARNAGRIVKIGFDPGPAGFSLDPLVGKGISLRGHYGYDWVSWTNCLRLIEKGSLAMGPLISHTMSLDRWEEGFELTRSKAAIKVILTPV
jgi:threonine dehydrogenase-like Zn-dependent dehydrogenase